MMELDSHSTDTVERVVEVIFGNGREGIIERMVRLEEQIRQLTDNIRQLREEDLRAQEIRLRWAIAIASMIISGITLIVSRLVWG